MMRLHWSVVLVVAAANGFAQDPVKAAPANVKVEIDNEWVRVLRIKEGPHGKMPMHEHPASVAVFLTDVHERATDADGKVQEVNRRAGDVGYRDAVKHAEENTSDQAIEAVVVELKPNAPKVPSAPITLDPIKLDPQRHSVPVENDRVRVLRTVIEPHVKGPMHEHRHYVVVYLTELHTNMVLGDGKTIDNIRRPGEVAWRDALKHQTVNVGDHTAVEIQVELK